MFRVIAVLLLLTTAALGQQPKTRPAKPAASEAAPATPQSVPNILHEELPNFKSDLAELRAMLNVLASQESGTDMRTSAALQTNRKMWQIVIYRLAELTQRLEQLETKAPTPAPQQPR